MISPKAVWEPLGRISDAKGCFRQLIAGNTLCACTSKEIQIVSG